MSGPIVTLKNEMAARWIQLGYAATPLLYDFHEVARLRDLSSVTAGTGRVIYHWGQYTSPEAAAGEVRAQHSHSHISGRTVATSADVFTVHCHGYDPVFADAGVDGATAAHEDVAWRLLEMFVAAIKWVVSHNRWLIETRAKTLVRDPDVRRFGELVRLDFSVLFSIRADPLYSLQHPEQKPTGAVAPTGDNETIIVEVP